ncbi:PREDICTED: ribosomal RNA-processing protein 7 homolog A [Nanorana parkeri]|uniref:ribosomal RNA-processing protein 7 homolog A n=1 Tax=Nanorana parkeri TaxID=125878 RepID=UPI0008543F0E|nr:PREDICTED: ribosomal RNA-processing protein 7 homolog A [Nanorana parkeri]
MPKQECAAPAGYKGIRVKFTAEQSSQHYLYAREHKVRGQADTTQVQNRTLFVINIPAYCTEKYLSRIFSCCGPVESVEVLDKLTPPVKDHAVSKYFHQNARKGYKVAYVVFKKPSGLSEFNSLTFSTPLVLSGEDHFLKTGIQEWIESYEMSLINVAELQAEVEQYMQEYDKKVEEKEEKEKEEGEPDEEGWVTVTRKGRRPGVARTETVTINVTEKEKKKRAQKELLNFYAWQNRNSKKESLSELRRKFEEDKQKIAIMRAQRKFRPY